MTRKYKLHYSEVREKFYGRHKALIPALVKINRSLNKLPFRAMNTLTKLETASVKFSGPD